MDELGIEEFARQVRDLKPGLVLLETSTPSIDFDLETAAAIKDLSPETFVALLGSHVTVFDRETLAENPAVDAVVRGEFEYIAADLARALDGSPSAGSGRDLSGVLGLTYRDADGEVKRNPDRPHRQGRWLSGWHLQRRASDSHGQFPGLPLSLHVLPVA